MKYNRFVFMAEVFSDGAVRDIKVIVKIFEHSSEALRAVVEDWDEKQDGELRSIKLARITTIEDSALIDGQADG